MKNAHMKFFCLNFKFLERYEQVCEHFSLNSAPCNIVIKHCNSIRGKTRSLSKSYILMLKLTVFYCFEVSILQACHTIQNSPMKPQYQYIQVTSVHYMSPLEQGGGLVKTAMISTVYVDKVYRSLKRSHLLTLIKKFLLIILLSCDALKSKTHNCNDHEDILRLDREPGS